MLYFVGFFVVAIAVLTMINGRRKAFRGSEYVPRSTEARFDPQTLRGWPF